MGIRQDLYASRKPLAGFIAIGLTWAAYFAQMPVIKAGVGASDGAYGIAVLWAALGAFAAMWLAPLAHRLAGGMAVPIAIGVIAVAVVGIGLVSGLVALGLMSARSGVTDVLVNAQIAEAEEQTGRNLMNLNHGLYSFAYAGSALATGALREARVGPLAVFSLLAMVLCLLAWAANVPKSVAPDDGRPAIMEGAVAPGLVWIAGAVVFFAFLSEASAEGWSALHIERTLGGDATQGALGPALLGLTMGIGRLSGHGLGRFLNDRTLMMLACILSGIGLGVVAMAPSVGMALIGFALAGLGVSVLAPLALALAGRAVPKMQRLAVISRVSVLGHGAFFFGPPMMGLMSEWISLRASFGMVAGLLLLVGITLIPVLTRYSRPAASQSRA